MPRKVYITPSDLAEVLAGVAIAFAHALPLFDQQKLLELYALELEQMALKAMGSCAETVMLDLVGMLRETAPDRLRRHDS